MKDENDFPRLTPPDDRYPAPGGLFRKPEELTDEQFDLLAAAWTEESLEGDSLTEFNTILAAVPSRRARAESFDEVRLTPLNDKWIYSDRLLKESAATRVLRRSLVFTLLSAAAVLAIIITGPAIRGRTTDILPGTLPEGPVMSEALIPEASPVIISNRAIEEPAGARRVTDIVAGTEIAYPARVLPITLALNAVNPALITAALGTDLQPMQRAAMLPAPVQVNADNWIIRSISFLANTVSREEKNIDGYVIASACVNGINNVLGWEMQLEQASNKAGVPVAVNFSSSLISFTAPVNKNSP